MLIENHGETYLDAKKILDEHNSQQATTLDVQFTLHKVIHSLGTILLSKNLTRQRLTDFSLEKVELTVWT